MGESRLREALCAAGASLFTRGYTHGASGNLSVALPDGGWLVTPTNVSLGALDPALLTRLDADGRVVSGPAPTKEVPLHAALYASRPGTGAVVHLHSSHATAVSILADLDPDDALPPLTAYYVMRVGRTKLLPYFRPGDPAVGPAVAALRGAYASILLANHGPIVAGRSLDDAVNAAEELEQTAKLFLLLQGRRVSLLPPGEVFKLTDGGDLSSR